MPHDDHLLRFESLSNLPKELREFLARETEVGDTDMAGGICVHNGSAQQTGIDTDFAVVTGFAAGRVLHGIEADSTNNRIVFLESATVIINFHISFSGTASTEYDFAGFLDGVEVTGLGLRREIGTAPAIADAGFNDTIRVLEGQVLDVRVKADGSAKTITPYYMTLNIKS